MAGMAHGQGRAASQADKTNGGSYMIFASKTEAAVLRFGSLRPLLLAAALAFVPLASLPAVAQQQPRPAPQAKAVPQNPGSESGLARRVEQLEEQLVDMQVVIGTLESLARGTTAPVNRGAPSATLSGADAGRLDGIETQIRALAAQLEQLQEQIRALPRRSGDLGQPGNQAVNEPPANAGPRPGRPQPNATPPPERTGFGTTVTTPPEEKEDEIGKILAEQPRTSGPRVAAAPNPDPDASPKQIYESAYGYLLQRDYGAAEAAFEDFLKRFPNDPLGANAQYWLGESLYVRGQYRAAASAFLKGYQNYAKSAKAPEALLKLAMSLQRLGQKDAACTSFGELSSKFPSAPAHVKSTANAERQRAGCS